MNFRQRINKIYIINYINLLTEIIYSYKANNINISRERILLEFPYTRRRQRSKIDSFYNKAVELVYRKYNV